MATAVAGMTPHEARPATGPVTSAPAGHGVEDDGADCPVPATGQAPSRALLPDPFLKPDGTRVTTAVRIASGKAGDLAQWRDWQTPVLTGAG
ncbi:hypothetical protein [Streptomyces achromogenes]|uniref:hypothetical protein n=1 Tax=Streptomyces achromogenes TaxID=67255 RepID=UPI00367D326C